MNISANDFRFEATDVFFIEDSIGIVLTDGREIIIPLTFYPFLSQAKKAEREEYELFGRGGTIFFPRLDEYLSVTNMVLGYPSLALNSA